MEAEKTTRLQFEFNKQTVDKIDSIKNDMGASTRAEAMRKCIRLTRWMLDEIKSEHIIMVKDEKGQTTNIEILIG